MRQIFFMSEKCKRGRNYSQNYTVIAIHLGSIKLLKKAKQFIH